MSVGFREALWVKSYKKQGMDILGGMPTPHMPFVTSAVLHLWYGSEEYMKGGRQSPSGCFPLFLLRNKGWQCPP